LFLSYAEKKKDKALLLYLRGRTLDFLPEFSKTAEDMLSKSVLPFCWLRSCRLNYGLAIMKLGMRLDTYFGRRENLSHAKNVMKVLSIRYFINLANWD
jgi:hypothetical protein